MASLSDTGYAQALYDEMSLAVEAGWMSGGELLKLSTEITADFGVVPATTLQAIQEQADKFAFLVNEREQQQLYTLIDNAIAEGQTSGALASTIQDSFAEGYHILNDAGEVERTDATDSWSKMVARTELSRAQTIGQLAVYSEAGINKVRYESNHGATTCDICDDLNGQVFPLADSDDLVPQHPSCMCALLPADADVEYPGVTAMHQDSNDESG